MATITPTILQLPEPGDPKLYQVTWGPMQNGDIGAPLAGMWSYADKSVQVEGVFGSGGTMTFEGSNDLVNFCTLTSPDGLTLALTAVQLKAITEMAVLYRPHITAGDGTTSLTVTLMLRRTTPGA